MGGKCTACKMDVVTKKSGHTMTGCAVSVCITPAAPSPIPIPYPTVGSVSEGITDPCMRTKIGGAIVMTVGSCMAKCHGNEPGTLKEVVSLNTAGPCFPIMGAPMVFMELGMAGITTSPGQMNKSITVGASGTASGAGGGGSGAGGGAGGAAGPPGANTQGPGGGGGSGGGSNDGAGPPSPPGAPGAEGQASGGHPVDVVTGTMYVGPISDFVLPGPFWVRWTRSYKSSNVGRQCGIGWGWSHSLSWRIERRGDVLTLFDPEGQEARIPAPGDEQFVALPFGRKILKLRDGFGVDIGDGVIRALLPDPGHVHYRLRELHDGAGNLATVEWDRSEVVRIVDSCGRRAELTRDGSTRIWNAVAIDGAGAEHRRRLVTYTLDERGDLVSVIDKGGVEWRYEYDAHHDLVREAQPDGVEYHFRYGEVLGQRRCVETWGELAGGDILQELGAPDDAAEGRPRGVYHTRFEYGSDQTTMVDGCGNVHRYRTNALGLVETYVDPHGYTHTFRYDELGNLIATVDGSGRRELRSYDVLGRRLAVVHRDGTTTRHQYDDDRQQATIVHANGNTEVSREENPAIVEQVDEAGRVTTFMYGPGGLVSAVLRPGGRVETLEYDAHGNPIKHEDSIGRTFEYEWDLWGFVQRVKGASGLPYKLSYDSRGEITQIVEDGGKTTTIVSDELGNVVEETSTHGGTTTSRYVAGQLVERVLPDGGVFRFGWDPLLRLRWIENPAGERYFRDYDGAGRLKRETTFAGVTTAYEYDGSGEIVASERGSLRTRFVRDGAGRIVQKEHSTGATERFRYDVRGGMVMAETAASRVTWERDLEGRVLREVQETGGWRFAIDYTYDALGRIVRKSYSSGWEVALTRRDEDGSVTGVAVGEGGDGAGPRDVLLREYDARGRESLRSRLDAPASVAFERDVYGQPVDVRVLDAAGEVVHERSFGWSAAGPLATVTDSRRGERRYEIDVLGRPTVARGLGANERFVYAPQGTAIPADGGWGVGRDGRPLSTGDTNLGWDDRGRLVSRHADDPRECWQYSYDENDQLIAATRGDGFRVAYLYDPIGRRIVTTFGDGTSIYAGWDGDALVEERVSTGGPPVRRVFDDDGYTPLLETDEDGIWRMILTDAAATPWGWVRPDLAIATLDLTTWGEVADRSGEPGRLRFAGQRADELTSLHYNRHRYYAPDLHVFLTPDPLGLYSTLQDIGFVPNVTLFIDPLGLVTIINGDPKDPVMKDSIRQLLNENPGAKVINSDKLGRPPTLWQKIRGKPADVNMIDPNEDHVIVTTHGAPGSVNWKGAKGGSATGEQVGEQLHKAGFNKDGRPGAKVDLIACNGATPGKDNSPSVAQGIANKTGATVWGAKANTPGDPYKNPPVWEGHFSVPKKWYHVGRKTVWTDPKDGTKYIESRKKSQTHEGEMSGTPNKPYVHGGKYVPTAPKP